MANVSDFKSRLSGGGARPNQFSAHLFFPIWVPTPYLSNDASFLCKAASLPGSYITPIELLYRGRQVHMAGERTFQPWTVTIYNDVDNNCPRLKCI